MIHIIILQDKLIPHQGYSAQVSDTYFMNKVSVSIFGIVPHTLDVPSFFVSDKRQAGSKDGNHILSYIY